MKDKKLIKVVNKLWEMIYDFPFAYTKPLGIKGKKANDLLLNHALKLLRAELDKMEEMK